MELLEQQLILERTIKQLQQESSSLVDKVERQKKESLSLIDLVDKQREMLKGLEAQSAKVLDKVREEKIAWTSQKREEEETLETKKLGITKILNRESYVKLQEQKIIQEQGVLAQREQVVAEKEQGFLQREEAVKKLETQADQHWEESKKVLAFSQKGLKDLKEKMITDINKWEIK